MQYKVPGMTFFVRQKSHRLVPSRSPSQSLFNASNLIYLVVN